MKQLLLSMLALTLIVGCGNTDKKGDTDETQAEQACDNTDMDVSTEKDITTDQGGEDDGVEELSVAVVGFSANAGISQSDIDGISAIFTTYFTPRGYTLVERMRIDKIIEEQDMQRSALTNDDMVQLGALLKVQKIVVGDIAIVEGQYNVDIRVVDVERGIIAATDGATWVKGSSYRAMMQSLATRLSEAISVKDENTKEPIAPPVDNEVRIVFDYLKVFPYSIGSFDAEPKTIIAQLNKQAKFGYDSWRIPTNEELSLLIASGFPVDDGYMSQERPYGVALLVTDDCTAEEKHLADEEREKARIAEEKRINDMVAKGLGRDGVYKVGDYYNRDGKQGVVFYVKNSGRNGKIVSLDQSRGYYESCKSWCDGKGNGWYMPSLDELRSIYSNVTIINKTLLAYDATLCNSTYWSTDHYVDIAAEYHHTLDMRNGNTNLGCTCHYYYPECNDTTRSVIAVCAF